MTYGLPDNFLVGAARRAAGAAKGAFGTRGGGGGRGGGPIGFQFQLGGVIIYQPVLDYYLHNPDGELGRYLRKKGMTIMMLAKQQVGVNTGALRSSIRMIHQRTSTWAQIKIGSNLDYAYMHHEGTKPHIITPRDAGILRFSSGGRIIYSHEVQHPGTRPNRYLSDQLWVARI